MKYSAGRCLATLVVALCVLSAGTLRPALPHLAIATKVRAGHHRRVVSSVCADIAPGDDDLLQESRSDLAGHGAAVVAARLKVPPTATWSSPPTFRGREPMRVLRPSRHACRRVSPAADPPADRRSA